MKRGWRTVMEERAGSVEGFFLISHLAQTIRKSHQKGSHTRTHTHTEKHTLTRRERAADFDEKQLI